LDLTVGQGAGGPAFAAPPVSGYIIRAQLTGGHIPPPVHHYETRMPPTDPDPDELITLAEASQRYGLSAETLRVLARRGRLTARKAGRDWMTTPRAMEAYLASRAKIGRYRHDLPS